MGGEGLDRVIGNPSRIEHGRDSVAGRISKQWEPGPLLCSVRLNSCMKSVHLLGRCCLLFEI